MLQTKIIWSILISRSPYLQKGQTWCFGEVIYHDGPKQTFADILQNRCYWNFCKIHRKHLCWSLFLPSFKRDSSTDNFLWIWQNFQAYLFIEHLQANTSGRAIKRLMSKNLWNLMKKIRFIIASATI